MSTLRENLAAEIVNTVETRPLDTSIIESDALQTNARTVLSPPKTEEDPTQITLADRVAALEKYVEILKQKLTLRGTADELERFNKMVVMIESNMEMHLDDVTSTYKKLN